MRGGSGTRPAAAQGGSSPSRGRTMEPPRASWGRSHMGFPACRQFWTGVGWPAGATKGNSGRALRRHLRTERHQGRALCVAWPSTLTRGLQEPADQGAPSWGIQQTYMPDVIILQNTTALHLRVRREARPCVPAKPAPARSRRPDSEEQTTKTPISASPCAGATPGHRQELEAHAQPQRQTPSP